MTTEVTTATSARAGGYAKGRATREEILDAAMQLFGEVGYHTASLREVASRVGISHPGLLHHFSSKAVLLAAVLERRDEVDEVAFEADLAAGHDYFDALAMLIERNAARPGIVELFATLSAEATSPDHPAHAYFQDRYRRVVAMTVDRVRALARRGPPPARHRPAHRRPPHGRGDGRHADPVAARRRHPGQPRRHGGGPAPAHAIGQPDGCHARLDAVTTGRRESSRRSDEVATRTGSAASPSGRGAPATTGRGTRGSR